jgi:hypothetical protein
MKAVKSGITTLSVLLAVNNAVLACPWCRAQVKTGVYDQDFFGTLLVLLLPILILAGIGIGLYNLDKILNKFKGGVK